MSGAAAATQAKMLRKSLRTEHSLSYMDGDRAAISAVSCAKTQGVPMSAPIAWLMRNERPSLGTTA